MYAVIKTGGKQYKVASGDVLKIEKIAGEEGKKVVFKEILALGETIGTPLVKDASVEATVVKQCKDDKVIVFKKKRRQNYRRKNGHRQNITIVKIGTIGSGKAATAKAETSKTEEAPKTAEKKPAASKAKSE